MTKFLTARYIFYLFLVRSIYRRRWKGFQVAAYSLSLTCILILSVGLAFLLVPNTSMRSVSMNGLGYLYGIVGYAIAHIAVTYFFRFEYSFSTLRSAYSAAKSTGRVAAISWVVFCVGVLGFGILFFILNALRH